MQAVQPLTLGSNKLIMAFLFLGDSWWGKNPVRAATDPRTDSISGKTGQENRQKAYKACIVMHKKGSMIA